MRSARAVGRQVTYTFDAHNDLRIVIECRVVASSRRSDRARSRAGRAHSRRLILQSFLCGQRPRRERAAQPLCSLEKLWRFRRSQRIRGARSPRRRSRPWSSSRPILELCSFWGCKDQKSFASSRIVVPAVRLVSTGQWVDRRKDDSDACSSRW